MARLAVRVVRPMLRFRLPGRLSKIAKRSANYRPILRSVMVKTLPLPYESRTAVQAVATDSFMLAQVPLEDYTDDDKRLLDDGVWLDPEAAARAEKPNGGSIRNRPEVKIEDASSGAARVGRVTFDHPERTGHYPAVEQLWPADKPAVTVTLDANLLATLADAICPGKRRIVELRIDTPLRPIVVTPLDDKHKGGVGIGLLMPVRGRE